MGQTLQLNANAKINLGLDVICKRADGYHEVRMIMQMVNLFDTLTFRVLDEDVIRMTANVDFVPTDDSNLVYKAIRLIKDTYAIDKGMEVDLVKRIPVAAGMAGGSTDCAAALFAAAKLFGLTLSKEELMELGVKLGADVPYCIMQGTALSEGIGEILTPLTPMPDCHILVAKPDISVSTKYVYEHVDAKEVLHHPDIDGMVKAIECKDLKGIASRMENVLESVTIEAHPVVQEIKDCMMAEGALNAMMSGSGPTVFGLYEDEEKAHRAMETILKQGLANQVHVTKPEGGFSWN